MRLAAKEHKGHKAWESFTPLCSLRSFAANGFSFVHLEKFGNLVLNFMASLTLPDVSNLETRLAQLRRFL
jgi:hypothetical protein